MALGAAGCSFPGQPNPAERPIPPDRVLAFDALYHQNCAGCHGADGKLGPAPPLNDPLFRAIVPAETVEEVVAGGRRGTLMPAFSSEHGGPLTPAQVAVLVNEITGGTNSAWVAPGPAPADAPPYLAPKDGAGDARAGGHKFLVACASCHGDQGQGLKNDDLLALKINDPAFQALVAAQAPLLTGDRRAFVIRDPAFLALLSDQALRRIVITGREDLGMPDYAHHGKEALTPEDVTNLVAFLRAQGGATSQPRPEPEASHEAHHE